MALRKIHRIWWFSKCHPMSIAHELVRKSNSLFVPDLLNQKILEMYSKINV